MSCFDKIIEETGITIGCIMGSSEVLFIKTGQGGSIYGYENKYLQLARKINSEYGFSVFISATTDDNKELYEQEMKILDEHFAGDDYKLYYVGVSKGGLIGCWYGVDNPKLKRLLMINAPLMINFHNRTKPAVDKFSVDALTAVYGTLDPSYKYLPFLGKGVVLQIVEGADHNFKGKNDALFQTVEDFLK